MRSFGYPLKLEHVLEFTRPDPTGCFAAPFKWGDGWGVANGFLALRVRTFLDCDRESPEAVKRVESLPWHFYELEEANRDPKSWGKLDDRRRAIWKRGELEFWDRTAPNTQRVKEPRVAIGRSCATITLPALQLIAKLPRVEVFTGPADGGLFFRFNGGEGIAVPFPRHDRGEIAFHLFRPAMHRLD